MWEQRKDHTQAKAWLVWIFFFPLKNIATKKERLPLHCTSAGEASAKLWREDALSQVFLMFLSIKFHLHMGCPGCYWPVM